MDVSGNSENPISPLTQIFPYNKINTVCNSIDKRYRASVIWRSIVANYTNEIKKRRTFAIISHPDAGKTTLTEKFLLYGGAINLAGSVKGKATTRHAVSDWMEIEKERGISVTSSVLQFE